MTSNLVLLSLILPPAPSSPVAAGSPSSEPAPALLHGGRAAPRAWLASLRGALWICWDDASARGAPDPGCWRRVDLPPVALDPRELRAAFLDPGTLVVRADDDRFELTRGDVALRPAEVFTAADPQGRLAPLACGPTGHVPAHSQLGWTWIAAACGASAGACAAPPALPALRRPLPLELFVGVELRARDDHRAGAGADAQAGVDVIASLGWSIDAGRWHSQRLAWDELQAARRPRLRPLPPPLRPGPLAAREREVLAARPVRRTGPMSPVLCAILVLSPALPPTPAPEPAALQAALQALPRRPSVAEVQAAALRRLAVGPQTARRWIARARAAAVLPSVQGEVDRSIDRDWQLDQAAGTADELSQDLGAGHGARARASWDLGRLIFNPDELRAARAALDAAAERERVLVTVTQLYFERQQLLLEIALLPARDGQEAIGRPLRVAEIEAILSGLTGLSF